MLKFILIRFIKFKYQGNDKQEYFGFSKMLKHTEGNTYNYLQSKDVDIGEKYFQYGVWKIIMYIQIIKQLRL